MFNSNPYNIKSILFLFRAREWSSQMVLKVGELRSYSFVEKRLPKVNRNCHIARPYVCSFWTAHFPSLSFMKTFMAFDVTPVMAYCIYFRCLSFLSFFGGSLAGSNELSGAAGRRLLVSAATTTKAALYSITDKTTTLLKPGCTFRDIVTSDRHTARLATFLISSHIHHTRVVSGPCRNNKTTSTCLIWKCAESEK